MQAIPIRYITDERTRTVTLCKRGRGLIKKASDLSLIAGGRVVVAVWHPSDDKLSHYFANPHLPQACHPHFLNSCALIRHAETHSERGRQTHTTRHTTLRKTQRPISYPLIGACFSGVFLCSVTQQSCDSPPAVLALPLQIYHSKSATPNLLLYVCHCSVKQNPVITETTAETVFHRGDC